MTNQEIARRVLQKLVDASMDAGMFSYEIAVVLGDPTDTEGKAEEIEDAVTEIIDDMLAQLA